MTRTGFEHVWEIQPENIEQVSDDIAQHKPNQLEGGYFHSGCLDCLFKRPHGLHATPSSLSRKLSDFKHFIEIHDRIVDRQNELRKERSDTVENELQKFEKEVSFEATIQKLEDDEEAHVAWLKDLRKHFGEETFKSNNFYHVLKPDIKESERRGKTYKKAERELEKLEDKFDKWLDKLDEEYGKKIVKVEERISLKLLSEHLTKIQSSISEDINWYRAQRWQPAPA